MIDKLKTIDTLTSTEETLVNYILHNTESFLKQRPEDIARNAFVSVSTIYRLVEKLGLNGIVELKLEVANATKNTDDTSIDVNYPIKGTQVLASLADVYTQTQKETFKGLNLNDVRRCAQLIFNANQTTVYSASSNIYFAQNFQFQMQEIGVSIHVPMEDYMQRLSAANSTEYDLAIIISYGGRSRTTQEVMNILKENHTFVLLISSSQDNPLSPYADMQLTMYSEENHFDKMSSFSSRLSLLAILDSIYACLFDIDPETHITYKKQNYQKMNRELK